jgi:hypothetical protein
MYLKRKQLNPKTPAAAVILYHSNLAMQPPTPEQLVEFDTFINEPLMLPAYTYSFKSWEALYTWTFRQGLSVRTHSAALGGAASSNIIQRLMLWRTSSAETLSQQARSGQRTSKARVRWAKGGLQKLPEGV